tara:strand:+ start:37 stop:426 length:390 start_codon:yes stop_codon:yes gene_type:complete
MDNEKVVLKKKGVIKVILETKSGVGKESGKEWKSTQFVISNNDGYEGRELIFAFNINGYEKEDGKGFDTLDNFLKYNNIGDSVDVSYNIKTNEWKGKYYTNLDAFGVFKSDSEEVKAPANSETNDDLPF